MEYRLELNKKGDGVAVIEIDKDRKERKTYIIEEIDDQAAKVRTIHAKTGELSDLEEWVRLGKSR